MHTTTEPHIDIFEMMKMEEDLGGKLLRQALQTAAKQGSDHSLLRTFRGPLNCLPKEEQDMAMEDLERLFNAHLESFKRAEEEERLDRLAEEQQNGESAQMRIG